MKLAGGVTPAPQHPQGGDKRRTGAAPGIEAGDGGMGGQGVCEHYSSECPPLPALGPASSHQATSHGHGPRAQRRVNKRCQRSTGGGAGQLGWGRGHARCIVPVRRVVPRSGGRCLCPAHVLVVVLQPQCGHADAGSERHLPSVRSIEQRGVDHATMRHCGDGGGGSERRNVGQNDVKALVRSRGPRAPEDVNRAHHRISPVSTRSA